MRVLRAIMNKRFCTFGSLILIWFATSSARADSPVFYSYTVPFMAQVFQSFNATSVISQTVTAPSATSTLDFSADGALYGASGGFLTKIDLQTGNQTNAATFFTVPATSFQIRAISFHPNGTLYGSSGSALYRIDLGSGLCTKIGDFSPSSMVVSAIEFGPDGTLYGVGGSSLLKIDSSAAAVTTIGTPLFRGGTMLLGDLDMAVDGNLYVVGLYHDGFGSAPSGLFTVDTATGNVTWVGDISLHGATGLASVPAAVGGLAPAIVVQPQSQTFAAGTNITFSVSASGAAPLFYQWFFNSNVVALATNASLTITNAAVANAGIYQVAVSNSVSAIQSLPVTLTSRAFPLLASTPTGQILGLSTNPVTATPLGSAGGLLSALDFSPDGVLYGAGVALYRIDTNTWTQTKIGSILTSPTAGQTSVWSVCFSPSGVLYATINTGLYTVDTNTAAATLVTNYPANMAIRIIRFGPDGSFYGGFNVFYRLDPHSGAVLSPLNWGLVFGSAAFGLDGKLYGLANAFFSGGSNNTDRSLYQIDLGTGVATQIGIYPTSLQAISSPAPLAFLPTLAISRAAGNGFGLTANVAAGAHIFVESSGDLTGWTTLVDTNVVSGSLRVVLPAAPGQAARFYRLKRP